MPKAFTDLSAKLQTAIKGVYSFGGGVGITHNGVLELTADWDAGRKADGEYQFAKTDREAAAAVLRAVDDKAIALISIVRDILKPKFGSRYSQAWDKAGFRNGSLAVPRTMDLRLGTVTTFVTLFETDPTLEVPEIATSAIAQALSTELADAIVAAEAAWVAQRQKRTERDAATKVMAERLRKLYRELKQFLPSNDPRWREFGFNIPAAPTVPAAPESFTVTAGLPSHLASSWRKPVGAERYRLFAEVVGVDEKPMPVATTTETSFDLSGLTSGAHVKLYVIAANAAGESLPSAVVEVVVP